MRTSIILPILALCLGIIPSVASAATWQELLDQADSLVAVGNLDSADITVDAAMSKALTQYSPSDTTVEVTHYRQGVSERFYFRSHAEAESLYTRSVSLMEKIRGDAHPDVAAILMDLASVYKQQGKYEEAKPFYERALAIREGALGPDHPDVGRSLRELADVDSDLGDHERAEPHYVRSVSILEQALDPDHLDVALSLDGLALLHWEKAEYAEVEALYRRSLAIREQALGLKHPEVAGVLNSLALLWYHQGRYEEAEQFFRRALTICETALGAEHHQVATILRNLGSICADQGRYKEAEILLTRALAIREKALGPEDPAVANSLGALAYLYIYQARYADAEPLLRRALAITEQAQGAESPNAGMVLNTLANLYTDQGRYSEAEPLHRRALAIMEETFGPDHPDVAPAVNDLSILYWYEGRYAEAELLFRRCLLILEKVLGSEHPDVANTIHNLAGVYADQGKYAEAELLLKRALAIKEKALGPGHPDLGRTVNNLANLLRDQADYVEAEPLYRRALAIWKETLGPMHPEVAGTLDNLAHLYFNQHKYSEAEPLFRKALAIREETLGHEHPNFAASLNNLAELYSKQRNYPEAEPLYRQALAIWERTVSPDHPDVASSLESFSRHHRLTGDMRKALETSSAAFRIRGKNFRDGSSVMHEKDALTYAEFVQNSASLFLSIYSDLDPRDASTGYTASDVVLSAKGQVSDGIFERQRRLVEETDSLTSALAESLRYAKFQLSRLFVEGPGEDVAGCRAEVDSLSKLIDGLERDLSQHSASFRKQQDYKDVSTAGITSLLPENSALVEYIRYDYSQLHPEDKIPHYLVVLASPYGEPVITDLGEASEIEPLIDQYRSHMLRVSSLGTMPMVADRQEHDRISEQLYGKIWQPIKDYVTGKELVMIAPDGALNMISFAGLIDSEGKYLVEEFPIHYLSSGRDVIRLGDEVVPGIGLLALGDPDYDASVPARGSELAAAEDTVLELARYATRNVRSGCGDLRETTVSPLPGTRKEVESIGSRWKESSDEPLVAYFGKDATEDNFKGEASGKRVIHLAAHGYFLEGACQPEQPERDFGPDVSFVGENPLLLSGLFFAGANLHGDGADSLGLEDGILTAYEVSALDLRGTEMVVLSACETGLGKVEEGEGVYGLRRAFQMAGARTVISALWPVADEATAEMMSQLYERRDKSVPETMRRIQLEKINELRKQGQPDHPFIWAGFIALGDWR